MDQQAASAETLTLDRLLHLRALTKDVSNLCRKQLRGYLESLSLLMRPRRLLGDLIEGASKEGVVGADRNFTELSELYKKVSGGPFQVHRELSSPLRSVSTQVQLYEWEYLHECAGGPDRRPITVTSPFTWVICYSSTYSLSILRQALAGTQQRDPESVREFVLAACLMKLTFSKFPALAGLFEGLRYHLEVRTSPHTGELPLVTVSAPFSSTRPADNLLLVATGLSGTTVFEEILDLDSVRRMQDPLREEIRGVLREHGEEL